MKSILRAFVLASVSASLAGCLKTRSDVKEVEQQKTLSQTVTTLQRDNADVGARFNEVNEEMRDLRGRVEVVEAAIKRGDGESVRASRTAVEQSADVARKNALLQEALVRLEAQMQGLAAEVQALRAEIAAANARRMAAPAPKASPWETGVAHFDAKDWKKAILAFQEYTEKNPKGKNVAEANYRIGVSFQELGLKDEAKMFYDKVVSEYPKSGEAKKARTRLQTLKNRK